MKSRIVLIAVFALMVAGVSSAQVPNDLCDNAIFVATPMMFPTQDTDMATSSMSDPAPSCTTSGDGVWYMYTPQIDGVTNIDTCGSSYLAAVEVFRWDPLDSSPPTCDTAYWTRMGCDSGDMVLGWCGAQQGSALTVTATAGKTYYVHVFDPAAPPGTADALRTGGSLSLNLDGAVPAELVKVGVD